MAGLHPDKKNQACLESGDILLHSGIRSDGQPGEPSHICLQPSLPSLASCQLSLGCSVLGLGLLQLISAQGMYPIQRLACGKPCLLSVYHVRPDTSRALMTFSWHGRPARSSGCCGARAGLHCTARIKPALYGNHHLCMCGHGPGCGA